MIIILPNVPVRGWDTNPAPERILPRGADIGYTATHTNAALRGNSMVEYFAVNEGVVGSNPTPGAKHWYTVSMDVFKDPLRYLRDQGERLTPDRLAQGFRAQLAASTRWTEKIADYITARLGTVAFLILNGIFFLVWMLWNSGFFGYAAFDPFPFGLLTMIVSLEAIFLSVTVLITQNRQGKIADLRQKMDFEIDVRAENEITKILQLLAEMHAHAGLAKKDKELAEMIKKTDLGRLEEDVRSRPS